MVVLQTLLCICSAHVLRDERGLEAHVDAQGELDQVVVSGDGLEVAHETASVLDLGGLDDLGPSRESVTDHCVRKSRGFFYREPRESRNVVGPGFELDDGLLHYAEHELLKTTTEFKNLKGYFYRFMPRSAKLRKISSIANPALWHKYDGNLRGMQAANRSEYSNPCDAERWLWHGTSAGTLGFVLRGGFKTAHSSMEYNVYGAGLYFAPDPRLAHFFVEENRGKKAVVYKVMLVRVAAGKVKEKDDLGWSGLSTKAWMQKLSKPENRDAPAGSNSVTSKSHTEVVTFQDNTAYPAYVFEYTADALMNVDPYTNIQFKKRLGILEDVTQDPLCQCPSSTAL